MATLHTLRVKLREKQGEIDNCRNTIDDLHKMIKQLNVELESQKHNYEEQLTKLKKTIYENTILIEKKDEVIAMKEEVIREKNEIIKCLEEELSNFESNPESTSLVEETENNEAKKIKRIGLSADPVIRHSVDYYSGHWRKVAKPADVYELLLNAITENEFMRNLDSMQIQNIVDCVYQVDVDAEQMIIKEGDLGDQMYILQGKCLEGKVEVIKREKVICVMEPVKVFGELAILYNCTRTASVRALTKCKLWALDQLTYQGIIVRIGLHKFSQRLEILKNLPIFNALPTEKLHRLVDMLEEVSYHYGEYIIRQFSRGVTCYILLEGKIKITKAESHDAEPIFDRYLNVGECFGEEVLRKYDDVDGVMCLLIDSTDYKDIMGNDTSKLRRTESRRLLRSSTFTHLNDIKDNVGMNTASLMDFEMLTTLGSGGFGKVVLCKDRRNSMIYAMKIMSKQHLVAMKQQQHVLNERNIMMECRCAFIVRLHKTFKTDKYLYMLLESCLGGELWSLLRDKGSFDDLTTKFYCGCVLEALEYLHAKAIVYRDLKPENLLLDSKGYCKLADFGFAKKIGKDNKTWTFCGTPEYLAPEVILNKGHDFSVDYWSFGILIFELLAGYTPFHGKETMKTYSLVIKGIEAVQFPSSLSRTTANLVKRLCRDNPLERFGFNRDGFKDVKKHRWFEGFAWENLKSGSMKAPYTPELSCKTDTSNFDRPSNTTDTDPEPETSGWDINF